MGVLNLRDLDGAFGGDWLATSSGGTTGWLENQTEEILPCVQSCNGWISKKKAVKELGVEEGAVNKNKAGVMERPV